MCLVSVEDVHAAAGLRLRSQILKFEQHLCCVKLIFLKLNFQFFLKNNFFLRK